MMVILIRNPYGTSEGPLRYPYNTIENMDSLPVKARSKKDVREILRLTVP